MRRRPWFRPLTAVLGFWLVLGLGDPGIVHLAAMRVAMGAEMGAEMPAAHDMAAMAHDMPAGAAHEMGTSTGADGGDTDRAPGGVPEQPKCPCVASGCASATAVALLDAPPATTFADTLVATPAAERVTVSLLPRPGPRYSRPYTTGPPRV